ncbi:DNA replication checkpoint protein Drc1 [Clonorchis sinensis]|uniref:DNA replication checkpoint protein Drc1 n=1 Tax=Clonorchis sinensis TaxID=79923 RepID=A0A8T1MIC7_CLOSI|nr:DNA replication checkpoint protein Drc1 [Clonorchis sinensis]
MNSCYRKIYFKQEEIADVGPSVNSDDIEQRIAARTIRIKNRLLQQRPQPEEQDSESKNEELSLSKKQIEASSQRIAKLIRDGDTFVSNIRVACDARENMRRTEEDELNARRIEKLEYDATTGLDAFNKITEKWDTVRAGELPQEIREMLVEQKQQCTELVNEKNKLINELNLELKAKDDHYVRELRKRTEDVELLTERMETQIQSMQKTYREELIAIEESLNAQKDKLVADQNAEWEELMAEIKQKQINYLETHFHLVEVFDSELSKLRNRHSEEYNELKNSLESEVESLEAQLRQLKVTYQHNLEKLEYNFQVLKRRDEENMITKSNQKRKITRLQDTLNNLHVRGTRQEKQYSLENEQLSEDYKRRMENFKDLQMKSKLLIEAEHRNFRDIWIMNEETLKKLTNRLLEANRVINEQQLGLPWIRPDVTFMCNVGPLTGPIEQTTCRPPAVIAMQYAFQSQKTHAMVKAQANKIPQSLRDVSPEVVRDFLSLLCYEPEFLIEEKLKRLLKPLTHEEETLMRLDTILTALGVTNEEELDYLFTHFIVHPTHTHFTDKQTRSAKVIRLIQPHAEAVTDHPDSLETETQPTGSTQNVDESVQKSDEENVVTVTSVDAAIATECPPINGMENGHRRQLNHNVSVQTGRTSDILADFSESKPMSIWTTSQEMLQKEPEEKHTNTSEVTDGTVFHAEYEEDEQRPWELVSPVNVVKVLHQFTTNMKRREKRCGGAASPKSRPTDLENDYRRKSHQSNMHEGNAGKETTVSKVVSTGVETDKRDDSHDAEYWDKYASTVVTAETEKVWDNLHVALERYSQILKHRAKLIHESEGLRRQNGELRHLLQQYLNAPVNYELQIPPAKTLHFD